MTDSKSEHTIKIGDDVLAPGGRAGHVIDMAEVPPDDRVTGYVAIRLGAGPGGPIVLCPAEQVKPKPKPHQGGGA